MTVIRDIGYMRKGKFMMGWKHHFMSKGDRERFFARRRYKQQKGIRTV